MPARSKARKRALDVLFEAEVRGEQVLTLLDERVADASPPVSPYAASLVRGVQAHRGRIDELLAAYATDWTLDRMAPVDRNILRIGTYELLWADDVPDGVAISEAVALARDLSTDASPAFVNGLLARLQALKPELAEEPDLTEEPALAQEPDVSEEPCGPPTCFPTTSKPPSPSSSSRDSQRSRTPWKTGHPAPPTATCECEPSGRARDEQ